MASHVEAGDVHVTTAGALRGSRGEVELVVRHSPTGNDDPNEHRFVYRYEYDEERTPKGFTHSATFVSWRSGNEAIETETFLPLSHVEQYLHHFGVNVDPTLAPGMYPMIDVDGGDTFADDADLDVEVPAADR